MPAEKLASTLAELYDLLPQFQNYKYRFPKMVTNILNEVEYVQKQSEQSDERVDEKIDHLEKLIMVIRVFLEEQNNQ